MPDVVPPAHNSASPFADMRGHHIAVRTPDLERAKRWYVDTLDFRVVAEWDYGDQKLAYIAPPCAEPPFSVDRAWLSASRVSVTRARAVPSSTRYSAPPRGRSATGAAGDWADPEGSRRATLRSMISPRPP